MGRWDITANQCKMKQFFRLCGIMLAIALMMTSCSSNMVIPDDVEMPIAINTINSVNLRELNLQHGKDYTILNTVSADATVFYYTQKKGKKISIEEENKEFKIEWVYNEKTGKMRREDFEGIARFGFLSNDYNRVFTEKIAPEYIVRNLAIYRLINQAKVRGADGVIEPVISTSAEARGNDVIFKTTVTAKLMKLNADSK